MKIKLVRDNGDLANERLVFEVDEDTNTGDYSVFACPSLSDGGVTSRVEHAFWFPDKTIKVDDTVVLYTKDGKAKERKNGDSTVHFFYWKKKSPIWMGNTLSPVLLTVSSFEVLSLSEFDKDTDSVEKP